ncbi:MAG: VanZ family protein [Phycisphaeraceae bacterium]
MRRPENDNQDPPIPPGLSKWLLASLAAVAVIVVAKLAPFNFSTGAGPLFGYEARHPAVVLGQVALFLPLGLCEAQVVRRMLPGMFTLGLAVTAMDAVVLSLAGETAQHWLPGRTSAAIDVPANALGAIAGHLFSLRALGSSG